MLRLYSPVDPARNLQVEALGESHPPKWNHHTSIRGLVTWMSIHISIL